MERLRGQRLKGVRRHPRALPRRAAPARRILSALCLLLLASPQPLSAAAATPPQRTGQRRALPRAAPAAFTLEFGRALRREIAGGEKHAYLLRLRAGQYARVLFEQKGIGLDGALFAPDGRQLAETNSPSEGEGVMPVSVVAEGEGAYRLEVSPNVRTDPRAAYVVEVAELRPASDDDRRRSANEAAVAGLRAEARRLIQGRTVEGRYRALELLKECLRRYRAAGDRDGEVAILHRIGITYSNLGDKREALDFYRQTLAAHQRAGNAAGVADALADLGAVHLTLGEMATALDYFGRSVTAYRAAGLQRGVAFGLSRVAQTHAALGEMQRALDYYEQSLAASAAAGDRRGEADTLVVLGSTYFRLGDAPRALDYFDRGLAAAYAARYQAGQAALLNEIGFVHRARGENSKALDCFGRALALWRANGVRMREASTLIFIGEVHAAEGQPRRALPFYEQALALRETHSDKRRVAMAHDLLGETYASLGERGRALEHFQKSLALSLAAGWRAGHARTLGLVGSVHAAAGEYEKALEFYGQALSFWRAVGDRDDEAATLYLMARAERARLDLPAARLYAEQALGIVERQRAQIVTQELRASFFSTVQRYYDFNVDLLWQLHLEEPRAGHDAAALAASERARARTLLELLQEARVELGRGVEPALLEQERALRQRLNAEVARHTSLLDDAKAEAGRVEAGSKELGALLSRYEEVEARIRQTGSRYAGLTQPHPLGLREIQGSLDPDTLLLEYKLGEERSYLWAVTSESLKSVELPRRAEVERLAARVYELLTARNLGRPGETAGERRARLARAEDEYGKAAGELGRVLLGPVEGLLGARRLLVVGDGALQYLAFAALPDPRSDEPLIVRHEVVSLPSASVVPLMRRELSGRSPAPKAVAVLADPVFDRADALLRAKERPADPVGQRRPPAGGGVRGEEGNTPLLLRVAALTEGGAAQQGEPEEQSGPPRLPLSRREAEAILANVPSGEGMAALGFQASRATALSRELAQYRIIHFATHGRLDAERPELSGLILSRFDERGRSQDGELRLRDIYNLDLPAELVVLSACQTGLGKEVRGEGLIGLTRGFMYAGARRVVASLWKVDDAATAELMGHFYHGMLREGMSPAAALRAAQVRLRGQTRYRAPYYWAAFVIQGEWR